MGDLINNVSNGWASPSQFPQGGGSNDINPSRLTKSTEGLRNTLLSRNLYTEFTEYPLQPDTKQKIVNSVSTIIDTVLPFNSNSGLASVAGRLISTPNTPLVDIGLIMLGKQFGLNFQSNLEQEVLPTFNIRNMFDGNSDTKLIQKRIHFDITRKTGTGSFENFVNDFFGYNPRRTNPFKKNPTNREYLENTGKGQLDFLFGSSKDDGFGGLNKNMYKPNTDEYVQAAEDSGNKIFDVKDLLGDGNRKFFTMSKGGTSLNNMNPYISISPTDAAENLANYQYITSIIDVSKESETQGYAPDGFYVERYMGHTTKGRFDNFLPDNGWINEETGFAEGIDNQFIWGKDGINEYTNERLSSLRGVKVSTSEDVSTGEFQAQDAKLFKIRTGLLEYTRNLLNSTEGQLVDQTKKIHTRGGELKGLNGSGLWKAPKDSLFPEEEGLRQHSILDQYDRFAKAIRFDGNQVYGGNQNSVIYKSVMPRIHPSIDDGNLNARNLMFSIENLAAGVNKAGLLDDGTQLPLSEVGQLGGRMMWFAPYGLELNEVAEAKYDSTVMVGRNEPIYSYMHSERAATLSFKLIIDYPEQLRNYIKTGNHKAVAEFFAFGGKSTPKKTGDNNSAKKESDNEELINQLEGPKKKLRPDFIQYNPIKIVFPNDLPKEISYSAIDSLYSVNWYEIDGNVKNKADSTKGDLNKDALLNTGVTENYEIIPPAGFTQSGARYISGKRLLDDRIFEYFNDPEYAKYVKIRIVGKATTLYTPNDTKDINKQRVYNLDLSKRRAESAKLFIEERIKAVLGKTADSLKISIEVDERGDRDSDEKNGTVDAISTTGAKEERSAIIYFEPTTTPPEDKDVESDATTNESVDTLKKENQALQSNKNTSNRDSDRYLMVERGKEDDAILKGFKSVTNNYFYNAFHSQTPEDFHKRLTFLQQCTRQGAAIRSNPEVDENGVERIKNSVFGKQPICVLRIADFFHTKVIIQNVTIDYSDSTWDTNPEGMGMQPMMADVTLQMKVIGGQSLKGPIDALQNAVSFNYYANSTFRDDFGPYLTATQAETDQTKYINKLNAEKKKKDNK